MHWTLCLKICQQVFHLKSIDGIVYGTWVRRIPGLDRMHHGLLVTWFRPLHARYLAHEVRPDRGTNIGDYSKDSWDDTSCFLMYGTSFR
eukprot:3708855-Pyramimonas_sp.AAC.1